MTGRSVATTSPDLAPIPEAPRPKDVPLPAGTRLRRDTGTMVLDDGRAMVGGSPVRLLRFRRRAVDVVRSWLGGAPVSGRRSEQLLARRLVSLGLFHARPPGTTMSTDDVTVVVPVRDRPDELRRLLATLHGVRTVVVDDGSRDAAAIGAVARAQGSTLVTLARNRGPAAARNAGLAHAGTALVAFVDSDCTPSAGWLAPLLDHFDDPLVGAAAPRIVAGGPRSGSWLAGYEHARATLDRGDREGLVRPRTRVPFVPTAALVVRRELAGSACFDESLRSGEDVDFVWRLVESGWTVRYDPSSTVAHPPREGIGPWLRQRAAYGASAAPLARRYPENLAPASMSVTNATILALAASRRPLLACAGGGAATALAARQLAGAVDRPGRLAARLVFRGTVGGSVPAVSGLARAWGPGLVVALASTRMRRFAGAVLVLPAVYDWARTRPRIGPARYLPTHVVDDVAYGAGVWAGCLRERTVRPLIPRLTLWSARAGAGTRAGARRDPPAPDLVTDPVGRP